jgi:hypothetical protein
VGALSILKPLSLKELSAHERSIRAEVIAVATRPAGGAGIVAGVVALTVLEYGENTPILVNARTR